MSSTELYDKLATAIGGAIAGNGWLIARGIASWWKKRQEQQEATLDERVDAATTVRVKELEVESESEARLWAQVNQQNDEIRQLRKDYQDLFLTMQNAVSEANKRVQEANHVAANEQQKAIAATWLAQQREKEVEDLKRTIEKQNRQIAELQARVSELEARVREAQGNG